MGQICSFVILSKNYFCSFVLIIQKNTVNPYTVFAWFIDL